MANRSMEAEDAAHRELMPLPQPRPTMVGLFGIPDCRNSALLKEIQEDPEAEWNKSLLFYDAIDKIASLVPGGLDTFRELPDTEKARYRSEAIQKVCAEAYDAGKTAVVIGHYMLWSEGEAAGDMMYTPRDLATFTHIFYSEASLPPPTAALGYQFDTQGIQAPASVEHLRSWQRERAEIAELRRLCRDHKIMFLSVPMRTVYYLFKLLERVSERYGPSPWERINNVLYAYFKDSYETISTMLVLDGDKTLCAEDTEALFWQMAKQRGYETGLGDEYPLKTLFNGPLGYTDAAFTQAMMLYEEVRDFDKICEEVASAIHLHPELDYLLQKTRRATESERIGVVVTYGPEKIWKRILEEANLSHVVVVGSGQFSDSSLLMEPDLKASVVDFFRFCLKINKVWAFGDGVEDLTMLQAADRAVVVVGDEQSRSKSMDPALLDAIQNQGLQARQLLVAEDVEPRLNRTPLPIMDVGDKELLDDIYCYRPDGCHFTGNSSELLLSTPISDPRVAGPELREAYRRIGWWIAVKELGRRIGLEAYDIPNMQDHGTSGHRLLHESKTCIIAIIRGGEFMALGISDAFPLASLIYAKTAEELDLEQIKKYKTIMLVDAIIGNSRNIRSFISEIGYQNDIRIIIVAGLVRAALAAYGSNFSAFLHQYKVELVALRKTDYLTGGESTDTSNRLFNTADSE